MKMWLMMMTFLIVMIMSLMFMFSKKNKMTMSELSSFECGFTSYYQSRFSFSMQFFLVGMLFLLLDLELCFLMPLFNSDMSSNKLSVIMVCFMMLINLTLIWEWKSKKLNWMK